MNAQEIYDELRADIKEMKSTLKELAMATTTSRSTVSGWTTWKTALQK